MGDIYSDASSVGSLLYRPQGVILSVYKHLQTLGYNFGASEFFGTKRALDNCGQLDEVDQDPPPLPPEALLAALLLHPSSVPTVYSNLSRAGSIAIRLYHF